MGNNMIEELFAYIDKLSSGNQMIAGAISLWFMGVITYVCREIPRKIWGFGLKHATTELITTSQNTSFHNLLSWFEKNGYSKKFRRFKVTNGKWGSSGATVKSVGYGTHIIWYGWIPIWVNLQKEDNKDMYDKETITITKIGRSHRLFDNLIKEIATKDSKDNRIEVYTESKGGWSFACWQPRRGFESVVISPKVLNELLKSIDDFISREDWYIKHGIPYSLGIMLYGPPGTGKTSLIRAIAAYLKRDIYMASATGVAWHPEVLQNVQANSLTVIEDVDSCSMAQKRKGDRYEGIAPPVSPVCDVTEGKALSLPEELEDSEKEAVEKRLFNSSDLLNALDGLVLSHGRILIMTTNYPEKLDSAFLRPGRCDVKLEIGYFDMETFIIFLERFFPEVDINKTIDGRELISETLTGANLQKCILDKMTCDDIISKYTRKILKISKSIDRSKALV